MYSEVVFSVHVMSPVSPNAHLPVGRGDGHAALGHDEPTALGRDGQDSYLTIVSPNFGRRCGSL
jgi:hypothetical protein